MKELKKLASILRALDVWAQIEDEGTETPTRIVILTDEQRKELLSEVTTF